MNVAALKLAHVDCMIARGRLVPLRRRPDTRPINRDVLWTEPCEQCGTDVNIKHSQKPDVVCAACRAERKAADTPAPRKFQRRQRSTAQITQALRVALRAWGREWFTASQLNMMSSVDVATIHHRMDKLVKARKAQTRMVSKKTGREWRVIA
jgi:hypothetical protein